MKRTENKTDAPRRPTPEEYRAARRRVQRETTRVVKRTLIGIALFAGLYYLYLASTSRPDVPPVESETPNATADAVVEAVAPQTPNAATPVENASPDAVATP